MSNPSQLQDVFLNKLLKNSTECTIHLVNGYQLHGTVVSYDNYVIIFMTTDNKQMLLYKHAVSSITPEEVLNFEK